MKRIAIGAALGTCLLSSCGPARSPGDAPPTTTIRPAVTNQDLAAAEAARLLALAQLPPGALPVDAAPTIFPQPAADDFVSTSMVNRASYWRVPASEASTVAWFRAHRPAELPEGMGSSGTANGLDFEAMSFKAPDSPAWRQAALSIGVAAAGAAASDVRIDGVAYWLDDVPYADTAEGARLHVTVGTPCPASDNQDVGVTNTGDDLGAALVPAGAPKAALICSYIGLNGDAHQLARSATLDYAAASGLAKLLAATDLAHLDGVVRSCPSGNDSVVVLAFSYPAREDVDIWYDASGCRSIANGRVRAETTEALVTSLSGYLAQ